MKKARLITLIASLCLLAFSLQGVACGHGHSHSDGGGVISWFDGM